MELIKVNSLLLMITSLHVYYYCMFSDSLKTRVRYRKPFAFMSSLLRKIIILTEIIFRYIKSIKHKIK